MTEENVGPVSKPPEDATPQAPVQPALVAMPYRGKSLLMIGLEVILISAGVFLGLMGEQWRERAQEGELAREALRRFRTEIQANRKAVEANVEYHAELKDDIQAYLDSGGRDAVTRMTMGIGPVFFEQAAWDLALATQALAYIDAQLAFAISRVYTIQQSYAGIQGTVATTVVFGRSPTQDPAAFWRGILWYLGDVTYFDRAIVEAYDEILPRISGALGERSDQADRQ